MGICKLSDLFTVTKESVLGAYYLLSFMREEMVCKVDTEMPVHQFVEGAKRQRRPRYGPVWPNRSSLTEKKGPKDTKSKTHSEETGSWVWRPGLLRQHGGLCVWLVMEFLQI